MRNLEAILSNTVQCWTLSKMCRCCVFPILNQSYIWFPSLLITERYFWKAKWFGLNDTFFKNLSTWNVFRWKNYQNLKLCRTKYAKSNTLLMINAVWKIFREFQSFFLFYYVFFHSYIPQSLQLVWIKLRNWNFASSVVPQTYINNMLTTNY